MLAPRTRANSRTSELVETQTTYAQQVTGNSAVRSIASLDRMAGTWTGSYTLTGKGTGQTGNATGTVNGQYQGQVQLNLVQSECSSLAYRGSLPMASGSIDDKATFSCLSGGSSIGTWVAPPEPSQNTLAFLSIDVSNKTYAFSAVAPLAGTVTDQACDGKTTTQPFPPFFGEKDQLHLFWSAQIDVLANDFLKETTPARRPVPDLSEGKLPLQDG
jgi:hypothetical protein